MAKLTYAIARDEGIGDINWRGVCIDLDRLTQTEFQDREPQLVELGGVVGCAVAFERLVVDLVDGDFNNLGGHGRTPVGGVRLRDGRRCCGNGGRRVRCGRAAGRVCQAP